MAQPKILLTRIDDRFIYGQDVELWNETVGSNLVLIVNDEIAADSRQWAPMRVAVPEGVWTRFFSVQRTIDIIHTATPRQWILIIVASPADALALPRNACSCRKRCRRCCLQRAAKVRRRTRNPLSPQLRPRSHREPARVITWGRRKTDRIFPWRSGEMPSAGIGAIYYFWSLTSNNDENLNIKTAGSERAIFENRGVWSGVRE